MKKNKVMVPSSVNVSQIVNKLGMTGTVASNLRHRFYYILSLLLITEENLEWKQKDDFYFNLCTDYLRNIVGSKYQGLIIKTLVSEGIIECNNSYSTTKGKCKGYRLTEAYRTGEFEFKSLNKNLMKQIRKYSLNNDSTEKYAFLGQQFEKHKLDINPLGSVYSCNLGKQLANKTEVNNSYQMTLINNVVGRYNYYIKRIKEGDLWHNIAPSNKRFNSNITSMPRGLRPYLTCNGEQLASIDIKASQPYLLASILNPEYLEIDNKSDFNIIKLYPEIKSKLKQENKDIEQCCVRKIWFKDQKLSNNYEELIKSKVDNTKTHNYKTIGYDYKTTKIDCDNNLTLGESLVYYNLVNTNKPNLQPSEGNASHTASNSKVEISSNYLKTNLNNTISDTLDWRIR